MDKTALITGVTGQDGLYLSKYLVKKGYNVFGTVRRRSHFDRIRLDEVRSLAYRKNVNFELCYGDLEDYSNNYRLFLKAKPDEIYNFASQSHVHLSYEEPEYTTKINANGVLSLLEAIKFLKIDCKFYQACSSELFGDSKEVPQTEKTPFHPKNPYAISKLYSYWMTKFYRDYHDMFACNGILYNHESPYRGENFVTRKITYSLARIKAGLQEKLFLGNYDSARDWGFAGDYVKAMWLMLQQENADDYLVSTGESHSVREFVVKAASIAGFNIEWTGDGQEEKGIDKKSGKIIVEVDSRFYRKKEENKYIGDSTKAQNVLGWKPKINFEKLVQLMMEYDLKQFTC